MAGEGDFPERKCQKMELCDLSGFKLKEVLRIDVDHKRCVIHVGDDQDRSAVIIIDKKSFSEECMDLMLTKEAKTNLRVQNDIYGNYDILLPSIFNVAKSTVIWPATEKHVEKYRDQEFFVVKESYQDYLNITLPCIESSQFSIQWISNFLEHKAESDRVIVEDPDPDLGFMLAPDLKWDGKTMENLYATAICHKHGIKSIRDLTDSHIPLLENMVGKSTEAIKAKYGVPATQLVIYLHYLPSYYHLHVHFVHIKAIFECYVILLLKFRRAAMRGRRPRICQQYDAPGGGAMKAHLVDDVLENIRLMSDYYQRVQLTYVLKANDPLLSKFREVGNV